MKKFLQSKFVSEYGTLLVLLVLFAYYTAATWGVVHPVGDRAAREVSEKIIDQKVFDFFTDNKIVFLWVFSYDLEISKCLRNIKRRVVRQMFAQKSMLIF